MTIPPSPLPWNRDQQCASGPRGTTQDSLEPCAYLDLVGGTLSNMVGSVLGSLVGSVHGRLICSLVVRLAGSKIDHRGGAKTPLRRLRRRLWLLKLPTGLGTRQQMRLPSTLPTCLPSSLPTTLRSTLPTGSKWAQGSRKCQT